MRLGQDPQLDVIRVRTRELIAQSAPSSNGRAGVRAPEPDEIPALRQWTADLFGAQLIGVNWPVAYGGLADAHPSLESVVREELARANAPLPIGGGLLAASAIIDAGTSAQKDYFLPRIRSGEHIWCQLFSEPDAGSDLANLKTRARRDGNYFVVDGQKVWTTNGQHADWGYLLARTNTDVGKHGGITAFALDMSTAGIDVRPLREITGTTDFNEVFFEGVQIPAENAIGAIDGGWAVTTASLARERAGVSEGLQLFRALDDLLELARSTELDDGSAIDCADVRQALGGFLVDVHVNTLVSAYGESRVLHGSGDGADAALSKILFSETNLAICEYGMDLQGADGTRTEGDGYAVNGGWWQDAFLYARAFTIAGGTNEVLRNLIAERALGLPRG